MGDDLADLEGLLEEGVDPVGVAQVLGDAPAAVDGADHDDRDVAVALRALDAPADVEAVHLGEHGVEEDHVGGVLADQLQRREPLRGLDDLEALLVEHPAEHLPDVVLVVDDEDLRVHRSLALHLVRRERRDLRGEGIVRRARLLGQLLEAEIVVVVQPGVGDVAVHDHARRLPGRLGGRGGGRQPERLQVVVRDRGPDVVLLGAAAHGVGLFDDLLERVV